MLLDAVLKSLSCSTYVPTVTVALILLDDGTLLNGRWNILPKQSSQRVMTEGFSKPNAKTAFFKAILYRQFILHKV